jgi:hypothetical protein
MSGKYIIHLEERGLKISEYDVLCCSDRNSLYDVLCCSDRNSGSCSKLPGTVSVSIQSKEG